MEILSTKNNNALAVVFPSVVKHQTNLLNLNRWWDKVALVGKINSLNVPQSLLANMKSNSVPIGHIGRLTTGSADDDWFPVEG